MSIVEKRRIIKSPSNYQEWMECFTLMKDKVSVDPEDMQKVTHGTFASSGVMLDTFHDQLAEALNGMINNHIKVLLKGLNQSIEFNEPEEIPRLFRQFKQEVEKCMFFRNLWFLEDRVQAELRESVERQVREFWHETLRFLQEQSLESGRPELEDALLLIKRMQLFSEPA